MAGKKGQAPRTEFSQALFDRICERIATGGDNSSLRVICSETGMPDRATFNKWRKRTPELQAQYDAASEDQKDTFFEEMIHIADTETDAAKARNRIEARKWAWSRMDRGRFGDKVDSNITVDGKIETITRRIVDVK
jgi:hypothetical protein